MDLTEKARLLKNKIDTLASQSGGDGADLESFVKSCHSLQGFVGDGLNSVNVDNISLIPHALDITVKSSNKIIFPYPSQSGNYKGVDITVDSNDGTIVCNGTASEAITFNIATSSSNMFWDIPTPSEMPHIEHIYKIALAYEGEYSNSNIQFTVNYYPIGSTSYTSWINPKIGKAIVDYLPYNIKGIRAYITIPTGTTVTNLRLKPYVKRVRRGDVSAGWTPYIPSLEKFQNLTVLAGDADGNTQSAVVDKPTGKAYGIYNSASIMSFTIPEASDGSLLPEIRYYRT